MWRSLSGTQSCKTWAVKLLSQVRGSWITDTSVKNTYLWMLAYFSNLLHIYGVKNCCKSAEKIELVNSARSQNQTTSPTGQLTSTPDHMKCWLSQNPFLKNHIASSLFKLLCTCKPLGNPFPPDSIHATCDLGCFDTCTVWQFKSNSVLRRHEQSNWTLVRTPTPLEEVDSSDYCR